MDQVAFEQATLDIFYRTERRWRVLALWTCSVGSVGVWVGARAGGAVLIGLGILCQLISWRAMRGAHRLEKRRLERMRGRIVHV